jgi:hypothetical protein
VNARDRTLAQKLALVFGATFLLAGVAGFIPGITTNLYDGLEFAGDEGDAELLGLFKVSILHNIVHALFGVGILAAKRHASALQYLLYAGVIYVVLFVLGLLGGGDWVPINDADDWLHLALAAGLLGGWAASRGAPDPARKRGRLEMEREEPRGGTTA